MIHRFTADITSIALPERFTNPFDYTPHPLCSMAWQQVVCELGKRTEWQSELSMGKMFGVLVVRLSNGELAFLAAFSGNLAGNNGHPFFVPPVYDMLQPNDHFRQGERHISSINRQIAHLQSELTKSILLRCYHSFEQRMEIELLAYRHQMAVSKRERDDSRLLSLTPDDHSLLIRQSQHQKAQYKRLRQRWQLVLSRLRLAIEPYEKQIAVLKSERALRSAQLQSWIFAQFSFLNARGEYLDLNHIFAKTPFATPPAGAGECAAPKLLQYAYQNMMQPLCMAEYWWGCNAKMEARVHLHHYPACKGKCEPILGHMLQGLSADASVTRRYECALDLDIVYADSYLILVNKPSGMLSVPGKGELISVETELKKRFNTDAFFRCVHRLDMDTSGLLIVARNMDVYSLLQRQFRERTIHKRYVALISTHLRQCQGVVALPLSPDITDRPRQVVDFSQGKEAITRYRVLTRRSQYSLVHFFPLTGRTHQLRVHAAHPKGLNAPIVGDSLYGLPADRLYLHAEQITFRHPHTNEEVTFTAPAPFF